MRVLADQPEAAAPFLPAGMTWHAVAPRELTPEEQTAWRLLSGREPVHVARIENEALGPGCLLIIDRAEQSQFALINSALQSGAKLPDGLACLALEGRNFQGQRGRSWIALRGNLHLTAYYRLGIPAAPAQAALTALPAVAAAAAIDAVLGGQAVPGIKWVNDVLIAERKVAGVLTSTQIQGTHVQHVVFGIGINVACTPALEPAAYVTPPGCLANSDPQAAARLPKLVYEVLRQLGEGVRDIKAGHAAVWVDRYRSRSIVVGREAVLWPEENDTAQPLAAGKVVEIRPDLSLTLEGISLPISRGRLVLKTAP